MTNKEHKQLVSKMNSVAKEVAKDTSKAKELLRQTGFYTKKGNLKKAYR